MKRTVYFCLLLLLSLPAYADNYVEPTWPNLLNTMLRLNTFDATDDALLDEYAIIAECPLYQSTYADDFKWNKVRATLRDSLEKLKDQFPLAYSYPGKLQLDRYDFKEKLFRFTEGSAIRNVNTIPLFQTDGADCGKAKVKFLPKSFRAMMKSPFTVPGLSLEPDAAEALLNKMKAEGNDKRNVYARFNLHVTYAEQLRRNFLSGQANVSYSQDNRPPTDPFRLDAQLDSITFFSDEDMKNPIWTYKP
jgi:Domain of unknown function (DUF4852)